ncbi:MAG: Obg family GTPase CgtA [Acidimicrobiia bacterium]|nr:Obg family GTPase CgtA [Acidimicrobiia bacterium]
MRISAVTRAGLDRFLGELATMVEAARAAEGDRGAFQVLRPAEEGFSVVQDDDGAWRVRGRAAERAVALADLTNPEAIAYVQERLRRLGVERALTRAGAADGDVVRIGGVELDYEEGLR